MRLVSVIVALAAFAIILFGLVNWAAGDSWEGGFAHAAEAVGLGLAGGLGYYIWLRLRRRSGTHSG